MHENGSRRLIYLACPYTNATPTVRAERFAAANKAAAFLISRGHVVYSPITMTHPLDLILAGNEATLGTDFWTDFDETFMEFCTELAVLQIAGWQESSGIARETNFFQNRHRPISYLDPTRSDYGFKG
jgi:hypothetical protein